MPYHLGDDADRHDLALTGVGIPFTGIGLAGFYSKDAIIERRLSWRTPAPGTYAFILRHRRGRADLLLFLAPDLHDLPRAVSRRADAVTHSHDDDHEARSRASRAALADAHESPCVMLAPLIVLAVGALFAGVLFDRIFIGDERARVLARRDRRRCRTWRATAICRPGSSFAPLVVTDHRLLRSPTTITSCIPSCRAQMAATQGLLYTFLYNKWYFDELYDFLFVRPGVLARPLPLEGRRRQDHRRARARRHRRPRARCHARRRALQTGYVYHYAFAMLIGAAALATWFLFSGQA